MLPTIIDLSRWVQLTENSLNSLYCLKIQPTQISSGTERAEAHLWPVHLSMICCNIVALRDQMCSSVVLTPKNISILSGTGVYFINCSIFYPSPIGYFSTGSINLWNMSFDGTEPTANVFACSEVRNRAVSYRQPYLIYLSMISWLNCRRAVSALELKMSYSTLLPMQTTST